MHKEIKNARLAVALSVVAFVLSIVNILIGYFNDLSLWSGVALLFSTLALVLINRHNHKTRVEKYNDYHNKG